MAEPNVMVLDASTWSDYAIRAAEIRLSRWTYALSEDGTVVVRGVPLPALNGRRFVEQSGIAIPAGHRCDPPLDAKIIRKVLGLADDEFALLSSEGGWDRIRDDQFVQATRSSIRLSLQRRGGDG